MLKIQSRNSSLSSLASSPANMASDKCPKEKRKTVNGEDLLWAMSTLGFEDYLEPLKLYLARYREIKFLKHNVKAVSLQWCDAFKQKQKASQQNIYFEKAGLIFMYFDFTRTKRLRDENI
ncbi:unnamed protein product [Eruca vesicaria subsp. sativa]|uniref:Transcription factor CBF/NF-Y/archaeal histone domain-containing protein n=1 Tax=Eruca vesicaria subsp. sativa TaxID=29727 RepID=A0ABC8LTE3_ERUVS|nr:unnamed protein product [Eruca vesicaria subsp. sativa]